MARVILRAMVIFASLAIGWAAARAQTPDPDFVLVVEAPTGATTIACVKGCALKWVERGINPEADTASTFSFSCSGRLRCSSGKLGGWVTH